MAVDPKNAAELDAIDQQAKAAQTAANSAVTSAQAASTAAAQVLAHSATLRQLLDVTPPPPPTDTPLSIVSVVATRRDAGHISVAYQLAGTLSRAGQMAVAVVGATGASAWQTFPTPTTSSGQIEVLVPSAAAGTFHFHQWDNLAPLVGQWRGPIKGNVTYPAVDPPPPPPPTSGQFNVGAGGAIIDPDGRPFIANGTNCTGGDSFGWGAEYNPHGKSGLWQSWGLNTIRHVHYARVSPGNHPTTVHYGSTEDLVDEYTARKMVVILDNHEGALGDPNGKSQTAIDQAIAWFTPLATKYRANPYVWFELFNEPQQEDYFGPPPHEWVDYHAAVAAAIRGTGNTSMILCCPTQFGQDAGQDTSTDRQSAILQYGQELVTRFGPRLGFSPHIYSRWSSANNIAGDQSLVNRFAAYRAKGFAIVVTECGAYGGGIPGDDDSGHRLFRVAPNVGIIPWMLGNLAPPGDDVWPEFWGWAATH